MSDTVTIPREAGPVTRPLMRYHGGKWRLAPWIISHFPPHRVYTEAFGGAGSVLFRKERSAVEVYNDLNSELCNLFRVLRDPAQASQLVRMIDLTPYARDEYEMSHARTDDAIEQARRTLFRAAAGHASTAISGKNRTGFHTNVTTAKRLRAKEWLEYPAIVEAVTARMRGVIVENEPAVDVLRRYDDPDALHYVDPPYMSDTRGAWSDKGYQFEMNQQGHIDLAGVLHILKGHVVLSGYAHPLYDELYAGWQRYTRTDYADDSTPRIEVLWIKPGAVVQPSLLELVV